MAIEHDMPHLSRGKKIWKLQCILIVSHSPNIDKNDTRTLYDRRENKYNMERNYPSIECDWLHNV